MVGRLLRNSCERLRRLRYYERMSCARFREKLFESRGGKCWRQPRMAQVVKKNLEIALTIKLISLSLLSVCLGEHRSSFG